MVGLFLYNNPFPFICYLINAWLPKLFLVLLLMLMLMLFWLLKSLWVCVGVCVLTPPAPKSPEQTLP